MIPLVQQRLRRTLDTLERVITPQADAILQAANTMLHAIMNGQKILACGARERSQLAAHFARLMVGQFEHHRPGLPVISLQEFPGGHEPYAKAIRALGGADDILFVIARRDADGMQPAIAAAHERGMVVILLTGSNHAEQLTPIIHPQDPLICLALENEHWVHEAELIIIHTLCDLIDRQLLGLTE
ncbi:SIS domain-containing protein [Halothiobacillus sp. DCM-1]|uniref:SIS domain-containing protein n=1 Tax=Halothiobacillus sp. DCM-1 TaxID=3112558 RepID=UPI00324D13EC